MATAKEKSNTIIFERRHPILEDKNDIWQLIYDSYRGGTFYTKKNYLFKNSKEMGKSFNARKLRAVYFNQVQPLADLLSGFLFIKPPARKNIKHNKELIENATKKKGKLNQFMKTVATYSVLFTCGVLVDAPIFDAEEVKTERDRKDKGIDPYCILYMPFQIRDFHIAEDGKLDWLILDNSYYDNSDYMTNGVQKTVYRLWTREFYQDYELDDTQKTSESVIVGEEIPYKLGEIPFMFVNWKDDDSDFIEESVFEDPALISRLIYNKISEMDEMLSSGSFKVLMYPSEDGTLPNSLVMGGIGSLSAIPYPISASKAPNFDGAKLDEITPYLKALEFYVSAILKKIGLDTDETKDYVKSGLAKKIDFQKIRTLLESGSQAMSNLETWIFRTAAKWIDKESEAEIHYYTYYAEEDIQVKVDLLNDLLVLPFKKLRKAVSILLAKELLTGEIPQESLDAIYEEIELESDKAFATNQKREYVDVKYTVDGAVDSSGDSGTDGTKTTDEGEK